MLEATALPFLGRLKSPCIVGDLGTARTFCCTIGSYRYSEASCDYFFLLVGT